MNKSPNYMRFLFLVLITGFFPTVCFSQSTAVLFNVNMKQQMAIGNFKPASDFVDIAGTFNSWGSTKMSDTNKDSIYTVAITLNVGDNIQFKCRINGLWTGLEEFSGGGPNRTYTVVLNGIVSFWYSDIIPSNLLSVAIQASSRAIVLGQSVQFSDKSNGSPVSWEWIFPGGTPAGSTIQNPIVTYAAEGSYPVTLKIKNSVNDSVTQTFSTYIRVSNATTYWWNDAVFYEVFVRSFYDQNGDGKGDLKGLTAKLDYLNDGDSTTHSDLGVTALWLMPIMQSPSYHGYDVSDYRTVETDYGTNADFVTLIQEAHQRGIKVIIDLVMNHSSDQNSWFTQSAGSSSSPYRNWYRWSATNPGGSWTLKNGAYYYNVFGSGMPDLNYATAAVKTEMFDIARFWLQDMHVDGFRLDAVKYIFETATQTEDVPETIQFWKDFRSYYKSVDPDAFSVGESWTSTDIIKKYVENNGLDYCFEFNVAGALVNAVNNGNAATLQTRVEEAMSGFPYLQFGTFLTNHDQERVMSTLGNNIPKAKLTAQLLLSLPGIPFIYYGEEIGTVGPKPDENIRTPLQWNNTKNAGFSSGTAWRAPQTDYMTRNIAVQQSDSASLWTTYNKMIQLRISEPALRRGNYLTIQNNSSSSLVFMRQWNNQTIFVASNLSATQLGNVQISFYPGTMAAGTYVLKDLLTGRTQEIIVAADGSANQQSLGSLPGQTTALYKVISHSSGLNVPDTNKFHLYPVPAKNFVTVQFDEKFTGNAMLTLLDMSGKVLKQEQITGSVSIPVDNIQPGYYLLKVRAANYTETGKIVIER